MPRERAEGLADFLRERVDEYLRGVVCYDADEYELLYLRPGIDRRDLDGTVRSFEQAMAMNFPLSQKRGVLVTLDPDAAR